MRPPGRLSRPETLQEEELAENSKIVLAIDIQREYATDGRPYRISGIDASLPNARKVMEGARGAGVPVWHVRHVTDGPVFAAGSEYIDFIPGFEPKNGEPVYTKALPSCFSSAELAQAVEAAKVKEIVVIGYNTSVCCICTIIDGMHRGYGFTLVEDAVASMAANGVSEADMHRSGVNVARQFARVMSTEEAMSGLRS